MEILLIGFIVIMVLGGLAVCSALYINYITRRREDEIYLVESESE
jgi:hypothetical protein